MPTILCWCRCRGLRRLMVEARDDYAIFSDLAERLGARDAFTEGRNVRQWLEHLYEPTRKALADSDLPAPSFDEFWAGDGLILPQAG